MGNGIPKDPATALMWYKKALEQHPNLAVTDRNWIEIQVRGAQAQLADRADTQGTPSAVAPIPAPTSSSATAISAQAALNIDSVPSAQSLATLKEQAAGGDAEAQYNLGDLYAFGPGVPQDYALAAIWYRKAAEQGSAQAQYMLGGAYATGQGVPQDYAEAYFWLDLSAAGKVTGIGPKGTAKLREEAAKTRDLAASFLTPADLSRVQERARKWFEDHPPHQNE
ncbi:MAG: tetratricopeptide repeat protein [Silvibacterium sp.]